MWLPDETFKSIIQHTPLISIDLIVRNKKGKVLLGKRVNAPAKGDWFVPGGRVRKNETLDDAFVRLVRDELGIESGIIRADAKFLGVFEHFYSNAVFWNDIARYYKILSYIIFSLGEGCICLKYIRRTLAINVFGISLYLNKNNNIKYRG